MEMPSKHTLYLSRRIGARGPGTEGEAAAASYILRCMGDSGAEVNMESFSCWKSDLDALLILYLAAIAGYGLFRLSFTASMVVTILVWFAFQMETYSWAIVSRILPRSQASNVVGRVPAAGGARRRVVITANYDTTMSSPLGRPGIARAYRVLYIIAFIFITALVVLSIVGLGASLTHVSRRVINSIWLYSSPAALYLLLMALLLAIGRGRGRYPVGANDNASGVGVMLSTLQAIAADPLEHTEVWGVATARGAAGGRGMVALLKRHGYQLKDAYIINVDHVGHDELKVITREGIMLGFRNSGHLKRLILQAAVRSKGLRGLRKGRCRVKRSDAMVATVRSFRAITIGGLKGGAYFGYRNEADTIDRLERAGLDRAFKLLRLTLDEIDVEGTRRKPSRRLEEELSAGEETVDGEDEAAVVSDTTEPGEPERRQRRAGRRRSRRERPRETVWEGPEE
ncbi:MAG: M28 family peptidase [Actinomycetota bacterium]